MDQIRGILIEDSPDDAELLQELLCELDNCPLRLVHVERLQKAFDCLDKRAFDVALLDLTLPDSEGLETFLHLRDRCPGLPIVVLTGMIDKELGLRTVECGAQDYLVKGECDARRIVQAAQYAVARAKGSATDAPDRTMQMTASGLLAGWRIIRMLGHGSIGAVYLVEKHDEDGTPQQFAMKILRPDFLPDDKVDEVSHRFLIEAEAIAGINHPNVVRVYNYGCTPQNAQPYIVMEYVEGDPLREFLGRKKNLDYTQKASLIRQIAAALSEIHKHNIFHRDIKPDNVLISSNGVAKLTDFGIARVPESELTGQQQIMGTPAYMAPEAYVSSRTDARSDIFSLGTLAYELFLGVKPFLALTIPELARQVRTGRPTAPQKIDPDFPLQLQNVLARMLKKRPEHRYQSAVEVADDFAAFAGGKEVRRVRSKSLARLMQDALGSDWT